MNTIFRVNLLALGALGFAGQASAEWRCDCTSIVGSCQAEATVGESFIEVTARAEQCARVDYFVDGIPFVALVVDGVERQDWIARSENPTVIVQSCQVCLDKADDESAVPAASVPGTGEPTRLLEVAPVYPAAAAAAGTEGYVDLRFTVSPIGTPMDVEIVAAEPAGVFEQAALAAINRWRYSPGDPDAPPTVTERIEFEISDAVFAAVDSPQAARPAPRPPAFNACVREEASYNFGAMIDVSLINACEQALVVHNCAAGTGAARQQWICGESELSASGRLEITRAPNSEYWWLACSVEDTACRDDGRQWVRSMHRQVASVNPQNRARAELARSY
jgi:TonB family protein